MYKVFESAMNGTFDLSQMLDRINHHHVLGNLTNDERDKLVSLARSKANPSGGLDVMAILADHDARLRALEKANATTNPDTEGSTETVAEYIPGKWYRNGDKAVYNGTVYTCTAPDGQVCVWSPTEYPAYWETVADA